MTKQTVLITGGTGQVGKALVKGFVDKNWKVVSVSSSQENINSLIDELKLDKDSFSGIAHDLSKLDKLDELVAKLNSLGFSLCTLVNNARRVDTLVTSPAGEVTSKQFLDEFSMNVVLPYLLTTKLCKDSCLKRVINISSIYGVVATNLGLYQKEEDASPIHYSVTKAALNHLTRELAVRLSPRGVKVNAVAYGGVEGRVSEEFKEKYQNLCPQGRMLEEKDLFGPVNFLSSESASGVTGQVLVCDGGWTTW